MSRAKQFALTYCYLSVNHAGEGQLTAASKSSVALQCSQVLSPYRNMPKEVQKQIVSVRTP